MSFYGWRQQKKGKRQQVLVELEASLAPAEAEVGAVAKADQKSTLNFHYALMQNWIALSVVLKTPKYIAKLVLLC
jgi:hypothetical protein